MFINLVMDSFLWFNSPFSGDEVNCFNDSYMFLAWVSDNGPYRSDASASRLPIAILPSSRYVVDSEGINLTLAEATKAVTNSFNRLSDSGIKLRDFQSVGGGVVLWKH